MGVLYLLGLLIALTGMVVLDRRFQLFFWRDWRRAVVILPVGLAFFLAWDLLGIRQGIFFRGETSFMTGLQVARELPVEEPFFLALLCYLTMNLLAGLPLLVAAVDGRRGDERRGDERRRDERRGDERRRSGEDPGPRDARLGSSAKGTPR
ncbi:lycopene cyclase domain-containing protein [Frondihabitans cladoniiphilus]|uniref:Lycopene cyclase domain-containing protein n=1 Tax=Frondihabitans cladoniiphilus TaxID=715785 RepID=A0ABP8W287_9MICO